MHLIFSTKKRAHMVDDSWRNELHGYIYIGGIIRLCGNDILAVNSVADHIHVFFPLPCTIAVADLVKEIKTGATRWIRERDPRTIGFHWQAGYGIFAVSPGHKDAVVQYIANQQEHHRAVSYQDEFRGLLAHYAIPFDEQFVWD